MSQQILQINFKFHLDPSQFEGIVAGVAKEFAGLPGLQWKIWLLNKERKEAGGIYLFENEEAVDSYKNSDLFKGISDNPVFSNVSINQFGVLESAGMITNAPLEKHFQY